MPRWCIGKLRQNSTCRTALMGPERFNVGKVLSWGLLALKQCIPLYAY